MRNTFSTANSLGADRGGGGCVEVGEDADGVAWRSGSDRGVVAEEGEAGWGEGRRRRAHPIRARRESLGRRR